MLRHPLLGDLDAFRFLLPLSGDAEAFLALPFLSRLSRDLLRDAAVMGPTRAGPAGLPALEDKGADRKSVV